MQKEYGKLTADQFKEFIDKLPEVNKQRSEFGRLLSELPKEKFDALMVSGFNWAEIYEGTGRLTLASSPNVAGKKPLSGISN